MDDMDRVGCIYETEHETSNGAQCKLVSFCDEVVEDPSSLSGLESVEFEVILTDNCELFCGDPNYAYIGLQLGTQTDVGGTNQCSSSFVPPKVVIKFDHGANHLGRKQARSAVDVPVSTEHDTLVSVLLGDTMKEGGLTFEVNRLNTRRLLDSRRLLSRTTLTTSPTVDGQYEVSRAYSFAAHAASSSIDTTVSPSSSSSSAAVAIGVSCAVAAIALIAVVAIRQPNSKQGKQEIELQLVLAQDNGEL
jgi:hypothetical protein